MPSGGSRSGAGAPIGNTNAYKHGLYSGKTTSRAKQHLLSLSDGDAQRLSESCKHYCMDWLVSHETPIQSKTMRTGSTEKPGGQYGNTNALKTGHHMRQITTAQRTKEFFESLNTWAYLIERNWNRINESALIDDYNSAGT
jgi:hypothetical protein